MKIPLLDGEVTKEVPGYDGDYLITNFGRLFSLKHNKPRLVGSRTQHGYMVKFLSKGNKATHFYIHRLVAEAFIPNPKNYPQVDHIDGDGCNNHVDNLRWVTHSGNLTARITHKWGTSKFRGVCWNPRSRKWRSYCVSKGKQHSFGVFESEEDAAKARDAGVLKLGYYPEALNYGT